VIGYEDLDDNGDWQETPDYGAVWVPRRVATGWAPYRYGHWAWVEPWGWTWIDDAPWGFAPFHYGRWVYVGGGWAWVPGRVVARPVYAPALVVFVGGRNWSLAIAGGSGVAWFPLAPEEPYVPAYRVSNTYIRNVNVTNVNVTDITVTNVNVKNINYRNRRERDGVTVVSRETFVGSRPVSQGVIVVPRDRLDRASVVGATAQIAPGRRSVLGQPTIIAVRHPPAAVTTREVVVQRPPPPPPVPFAAREQALRARPGRPLDDTTLGTLRARTPAGHVRPLVRPAVPPTAEGPSPSPSPSPSPALRPAREGIPPRPRPRERPQPTEPLQPTEKPQPAARNERPAGRARRPTPTPAPAAAPEERKAPRAEPRPQHPERRPAPEERPQKERKAERDTTKEKTPS